MMLATERQENGRVLTYTYVVRLHLYEYYFTMLGETKCHYELAYSA